MALQKHKVFVPFGQGIDTKTDAKMVIPGKLTTCENGVFKKNGRTDKRNGADVLGNKALDDTTLSGATANAVFNSELLQYNKQRVYSYSENSDRWVDKGPSVSASITTTQIKSNTTSKAQCDYASTGGIAVYAWENLGTAGIYASVYDESEMVPMLSDALLRSGAVLAKCLAFKGYLYVFYGFNTTLYGRRINPKQPTAFESEVVITTDLNSSNSSFDIYNYADQRIAFAYNKQSASEISFGWLDENLGAYGGSLAPVTIVGAATSSLTILKGASDRFFVLWANTTDGLRCKILNNGGATLVATFTVDNYVATEIVAITGVENRDASGMTIVYHVTIASATYNHYLKTNTITNAGTPGTASVFLRSVGLHSKAWSYYFSTDSTDHWYVGITYQSTLQSTYFIVRNDGMIVAKMQYSNACARPAGRRLLAEVAAETSTKFSFAILNKTRLVSENDDVFSVQGIAKTSIEFDASEQFNSVQIGNNLHIVGGLLSMYDGQSVVEHGFHFFPELSVGSTTGATGFANGTYSFVTLYEWIDNFGQIHRSAPSDVTNVTVVGGPKQIVLAVPTLRLTQKRSANGGTRTDVSLVAFMLLNGTYYRATSPTVPTLNDVTADTVNVTITTSVVGTEEILYTTGGVLENISPPSCKYITSFKNRIFLAGLENKDEIWYSKVNSAGEPVEFNNNLNLIVASEGGGITALDVLDDKVVLFKRDRFFITYGDGPNNTGQGQEFAQPQLITSDAGCPYHNSIARLPGQILFKSLKGIYSLNSGLAMSYIGSPGEDYNALTITSATVKVDDNQVRFTTLENPTLIYDYYQNQWSTGAVQMIKDSVMWNGYYVYIDTTGDVYQENSTSFRDNGRAINFDIVTGWLSLDTIGGLQRVYRIAVVGDYKSPHKARISIGYDFANDFSDVFVFDSDTAFGNGTWGSETTWGSGSPWGGVNNSLRYVLKPSKQKCQSLRIRIQDLITAATDGSGEGFTITGLILEVGIKGQVGKFRSEQIVAQS